MSELLPEGEYEVVVEKAERDTLSDGTKILALQLLAKDKDGVEHRVYDVIQTQEKLDEFLRALGLPPGAKL